MNKYKFSLSLNQCRQLVVNGVDLRDFLDTMNNQPQWLVSMDAIDTIGEIQAVLQGGCESGAYMPACTYHTALATMNEHSNEIFDFIQEQIGELPQVPDRYQHWAGMASFYCIVAVEAWCQQFSNELDGVDWD